MLSFTIDTPSMRTARSLFDAVTSLTASNPNVHGAEAAGTVNRHVCATKLDVLLVERPITFVTPSRAIHARYGHNPLFSGV